MSGSPAPDEAGDAPEFSWLAPLGAAGVAFIATAYAFGKGDTLDVSGARLVLAVAVYAALTILVPVVAAWEKRRLTGRRSFGATVAASVVGAIALRRAAEGSATFEYWMWVVAGGFMAGATVMGIRTGIARMRDADGA